DRDEPDAYRLLQPQALLGRSGLPELQAEGSARLPASGREVPDALDVHRVDVGQRHLARRLERELHALVQELFVQERGARRVATPDVRAQLRLRARRGRTR